MSLEQKTSESLDRYLTGRMDTNERQAFDERLTSEPKLAQQLNFNRKLNDSLSDEATLAFQAKVAAEGRNFLAQQGGSGATVRSLFTNRRSWAIAAAVLVLLASAAFFWQWQSNSPTTSSSDLFATYYTTLPVDNLRNITNATDDPFSAGAEAYTQNNFAEAINLWEPLLNDPAAASMKFRMGLANAYMSDSPAQLPKAEAQLDYIINDGLSGYVTRAKWYLALVKLKQEDFAAARDLLVEVNSGKDPKLAQQAAALLAEIP